MQPTDRGHASRTTATQTNAKSTIVRSFGQTRSPAGSDWTYGSKRTIETATNRGSSLSTHRDAKARQATVAIASGRSTRARRTASATQLSVSSHRSAPTGCCQRGCHSTMPGRDRRTVVAMNTHALTPYGFASVAPAHSSGTPNEIHGDGRVVATPTTSSADQSTKMPAPTIHPPWKFTHSAKIRGSDQRYTAEALRMRQRATSPPEPNVRYANPIISSDSHS